MRHPLLLAVIVSGGCIGTINGTGEPVEGNVDAAVSVDAIAPETFRRLFDEWSGCMTIDNFKTARMAEAWGQMTGDDGRLCRNCHSDGAFGFIATQNEEVFFTGISQHLSLLAMYFRIDAQASKVVVNTVSLQSAARRPGHPSFNAQDNAGVRALQAFHAATEANVACGAPTLVD